MSTLQTQAPRPAAIFLADHLALDFLNTTGAPWGKPIEWLSDGSDLIEWLLEARAVPSDVAAQYRTENDAFGSLDAVAEQARGLREWWRGFVERHAGKPLTARTLSELEPLNRLLARDDLYHAVDVANGHLSVDAGARALRLRQERRWTIPERLLQPIAEAISDLVCEADFSLVRLCEGPTCTFTFYDRTKAHARRWCTMAVCGNRAKAAAHRARLRDEKKGRH